MADKQIDSLIKTVKRTELNLHGKLKTNFLKCYPHHSVPAHNLNNIYQDDTNSINDDILHQEFPYHSDLPKPLLPPVRLPRSVLCGEDPALQLMLTKAQMMNDINRITEYYEKHKKELEPCQKKDILWKKNDGLMYTKIPRYVADISEIIELDPDPTFKGKYNWYYTGGSLCNVLLNGKRILLFPYNGELAAVPIVANDVSLWKPELKIGAKCITNGTLYELKCSSSNNTCQLLGRYKHHCVLYSLAESKNRLKLMEIHKQKSHSPYVSADLNLLKVNTFYTANTDRIVTLWDLLKEKCINSGQIDETKVLEDNWGSIRSQEQDPNILLYADRCCLHYLDTRMPLKRPVLSLCPKSNLEECESLCLTLQCRLDACQYIGSYHSLLLCDSRSPKSCVQQKWTHQFKSAPLIGSIYNRNETEIIVLSSQLPRENTIILNTWENTETPHSYNLPYTPPSILDSLTASQQQGKCLDPSMRIRAELSTAGSLLIPDGDIFYQGITHEEVLNKFSIGNCNAYMALEAWERANRRYNDTVLPLVVSSKLCIDYIYESLNNKKLHLKRKECPNVFIYEPTWRQSVTKLNSYVDILAPELLSAWDISEEPVTVPLSAIPYQKVLNWLESSDTKELPVSQPEEIDCTFSEVNTQELVSVSQVTDVTCVQDSANIQECLFPSSNVRPVKKNIKKKRYTSGF
ncbi:uncharacterized protein LOC105699921 isoform X2 [Orussus abietinus]|uniref:uncharacterized protein LOC105699921 isoform X2 n=1 Tax=Orussus abietinus TaxID=222816 RepID=UPI00062669B0|nr:uncharacterized protein LOC105699921 isoform X2 [Orussus abietinus]